jgi:BioD-like phosphotransacetylase family protein
MDEDSGDGGGRASVATPLMGGTLTQELREVVSQMVHETVQVHVAEIDRILEDKIASLGQVLMTHLGGVIRNALPAPVDAAQQGHQLQRQLLPRHNNPRNV